MIISKNLYIVLVQLFTPMKIQERFTSKGKCSEGIKTFLIDVCYTWIMPQVQKCVCRYVCLSGPVLVKHFVKANESQLVKS